jgi:hypothetical protein
MKATTGSLTRRFCSPSLPFAKSGGEGDSAEHGAVVEPHSRYVEGLDVLALDISIIDGKALSPS